MSYATRPGEPKPLGATVNDDGVKFSIFSQHATDVDLLLFVDPTYVEPAQVVRLAARTLYFWHVQVDGLPKNTSYAFRFHGPGSDADARRFGHRFNANPVTGLPLTNFWGYDPISFFAPQAGYCVSPNAATHVREFRDLVRAAHRHGLEIILDVVFNHTGEGDQNGPMINLNGIDNSVFYWLAAGDKSWYRGDLTGCGNALRFVSKR